MRKPSSIVRSWLAMPIRTWPSTYVGRALGVKRDEVERRADLAGRVVRAAQAVLEEARG